MASQTTLSGLKQQFSTVPTLTGTNASGTWNINISGSAGSAPITTGSVLSATASASVGAVGTYAFLTPLSDNGSYERGTTAAGSTLRYSNVGDGDTRGTSGFSPDGTWMRMGSQGKFANGNNTPTGSYLATLWLRIS